MSIWSRLKRLECREAERLQDYITCDTCGVYAARTRSKRIEVTNMARNIERWYCTRCAPVYDTMTYTSAGIAYYKSMKPIRVDQNGREIV